MNSLISGRTILRVEARRIIYIYIHVLHTTFLNFSNRRRCVKMSFLLKPSNPFIHQHVTPEPLRGYKTIITARDRGRTIDRHVLFQDSHSIFPSVISYSPQLSQSKHTKSSNRLTRLTNTIYPNQYSLPTARYVQIVHSVK